jgi:hypothetical protein
MHEKHKQVITLDGIHRDAYLPFSIYSVDSTNNKVSQAQVDAIETLQEGRSYRYLLSLSEGQDKYQMVISESDMLGLLHLSV